MLPQRTKYFCSPSLYSFVVFRFCFCMLIVCSPNRVPSPVQLLFLLLFWFCSRCCCYMSVSLFNCACCCCHPWKWHSMPPYSFCCIVPLGNEGHHPIRGLYRSQHCFVGVSGNGRCSLSPIRGRWTFSITLGSTASLSPLPLCSSFLWALCSSGGHNSQPPLCVAF